MKSKSDPLNLSLMRCVRFVLSVDVLFLSRDRTYISILTVHITSDPFPEKSK